MSIYGNPVMLGGSGGGGGDIPWNDNFSVNWDFTNPVNTRGQSSYSSSNLIYSLDGWQLQGGTLDIESGGIRLTRYASSTAGYFMQRYPSAWTSAFITFIVRFISNDIIVGSIPARVPIIVVNA